MNQIAIKVGDKIVCFTKLLDRPDGLVVHSYTGYGHSIKAIENGYSDAYISRGAAARDLVNNLKLYRAAVAKFKKLSPFL